MDDWSLFLAPYEQVVKELKTKLRSIRSQYMGIDEHAPVEFVTGRVKTKESILDKCRLRGIDINHLADEMYDIAGVRIMCQFVEDIPEVISLIKNRTDLTVVKEIDYLSMQKASGYRSYHLIVKYPIYWRNEEREYYAEIQIRTLAMNFWATIEHSLNYKYRGEYPDEIKKRLIRVAEAAYLLDNEMSEIRAEVKDAQIYLASKNKGR